MKSVRKVEYKKVITTISIEIVDRNWYRKPYTYIPEGNSENYKKMRSRSKSRGVNLKKGDLKDTPETIGETSLPRRRYEKETPL